jgi:hypothetical protein
VAKRGSGWLVLGVIAIAMLVMLPMLLPQIMETLSRFGLWRP